MSGMRTSDCYRSATDNPFVPTNPKRIDCDHDPSVNGTLRIIFESEVTRARASPQKESSASFSIALQIDLMARGQQFKVAKVTSP